MDPLKRSKIAGAILAISAYAIWGGFPLYFDLLKGDVPSHEILAYRAGFAFVGLLPVIFFSRRVKTVHARLIDPSSRWLLAGSGLLIAVNWLIFIELVANKQVLQSSLGYYINPLVSVLFGVFLLKERLRRPQVISVVLAMIGVAAYAWKLNAFPWGALGVAFTFGGYGLLRKLNPTDAVTALFIETMYMAPVAFAFLAVSGTVALVPPQKPGLLLLLIGSGLITAAPLLLFGAAARRLQLSALGFAQYLTPTLHFVCAVFILGEAFDWQRLLSFLFIWTALILFSIDSLRQMHRAGPSSSKRPEASV
jgi:chloramphenicol-sensitive protein RarD